MIDTGDEGSRVGKERGAVQFVEERRVMVVECRNCLG